jgi:hypothetical protein
MRTCGSRSAIARSIASDRSVLPSFTKTISWSSRGASETSTAFARR